MRICTHLPPASALYFIILPPKISHYSILHISSHKQQFIGAERFNQDLSSWNIESVTSSDAMFDGATAFNNNTSQNDYYPKFPTPKPTTPQPTPSTPNPTPAPTTLKPTVKPTSCYTLDVNITLDQYPADTRWEIVPAQEGKSSVVTSAIVTSPPYDDSLQYKAADIVSTCLPEGMYDFIIYDVYGDGM